MNTKYIFVVGGVMSGIGKGVAASSIGKILQSRGWKVSAMKIDPYLNVDAGTMNPVEHGEVFVTADGLECDQDIGNYERFLDIPMHKENYMTSGSVYQSVINRERNLEYGGKCVQIVPHIPEEVIRRIRVAAKKDKAEIMMIEIGGTVGEYENLLFLEAARMLRLEHPGDVLCVMVSYLPIPSKIGEMKTKPTQHAVRALQSAGIQPDIILARAELPLDQPRKRKLSVFCNLREEDVISAPDIDTIYEVPVNFEKDQLSNRIIEKLQLRPKQHDLVEWRAFLRTAKKRKPDVSIGVVGKYFSTGKFSLSDSYISVIEALKHAAWAEGRNAKLTWLDAESYAVTPRLLKTLSQFDGIVVPGGFGARGIEGKIQVITYCRKNNIPYFGLCYGMQLMVIEYARNCAKLKRAHTREVDPNTPHPVIDVMEEQIVNLKNHTMGGTMRLGNYTCKLTPGTVAENAYGTRSVVERHRHRYEVNSAYIEQLVQAGLVFSGKNPETHLVEIAELPGHPFFVGTQFHPEFTSRPLSPHPLFRAFIRAAKKK